MLVILKRKKKSSPESEDPGDKDNLVSPPPPSCQCIDFKGYCSCTYPLYALTEQNENSEIRVEAGTTIEPSESDDVTQDLNVPTNNRVLEKHKVKKKGGKKKRYTINCTLCNTLFTLAEFRNSSEHRCLQIPSNLEITPRLFGNQEGEDEIEGKEMKKKQLFNQIYA